MEPPTTPEPVNQPEQTPPSAPEQPGLVTPQPPLVVQPEQPAAAPSQPQTFDPPAVQPSIEQPPVAPQPPEPPQPLAAPVLTPATPIAKKSRKPLIIGIVAAVVLLLLVAGFFGVKAMGKKDNKSSGSGAGAPSTAQKANEAVTAETLSDYMEVCQSNGKTTITNAAAYQTGAKPHVIEVFRQGIINKYSSSSAGLPSGSEGDSKNVTTVQLVGCINVKTATITEKKCPYKTTGDQTIDVPLYTVVYQFLVYEAKTGKRVGTATDIADSGTRCPIVATYDKADPKIYSSPSTEAIKTTATTYVNGN